jgi:hypothetical protein
MAGKKFNQNTQLICWWRHPTDVCFPVGEMLN